jgi:acyl carrier protein
MAPEAVVARVFGRTASELNDATSPETVGEWDSLGHITLIIELEAAYGVSFGPEEAMAMTSVGAIKAALRAHGVA